MKQLSLGEAISYPWLVFQLNGVDYCITTKSVLSVMGSFTIIPIPEKEFYILGIVKSNHKVIPVVDLRTLFHYRTLEEDFDSFASMKEKHIKWVKALEDSVLHNTQFYLNTNPHECAFGIWYDNYKTDNNRINFILHQIDKPHKELHGCAQKIEEAILKKDNALVKKIILQAKDLCYNKIIPLLDKLIEAYKDINKGILIILCNDKKQIAILVDNVSEIYYFKNIESENSSFLFTNHSYLKSILTDSKNKIWIELNSNALLALDTI